MKREEVLPPKPRPQAEPRNILEEKHDSIAPPPPSGCGGEGRNHRCRVRMGKSRQIPARNRGKTTPVAWTRTVKETGAG